MAGLRKILLVEDNLELRNLYEIFLKQHGYDVAIASDGDEGLERARDYKPDLIFFKALMNTQQQANPAICTRSLKLLGDFWTLNIIAALEDGEMRYCDLQRAAGGVNPVTLGNRLRKLTDAGLIERHASTDDISVSYELTNLGKAALPVLRAVDTFSRQLPKEA